MEWHLERWYDGSYCEMATYVETPNGEVDIRISHDGVFLAVAPETGYSTVFVEGERIDYVLQAVTEAREIWSRVSNNGEFNVESSILGFVFAPEKTFESFLSAFESSLRHAQRTLIGVDNLTRDAERKRDALVSLGYTKNGKELIRTELFR